MKLKIKAIGVLITTAIICSAVPAKAWEAYDPYNYNSYGESVASMAGYSVDQIYNAAAIGVDILEKPTDICYDNEKVYVLDSGNGRVVILDKNMRLLKTVEKFLWNNESIELANPGGLFVRDGRMLVADTDNRQVLECDENGVVHNILSRPTAKDDSASGYFETLDFKPVKAIYSGKTDIYVIVENCYYGILRFSLDGGFHGFFGANFVETSFQQKMDQTWKRLLTKEQRKYLSNYVPSEYASIDIDNEGFIYTAASKVTGSKRELQKLNNKGINILQADEQFDMLKKSDYGDKERLRYRGTYVDSKIVDVSVSDNGIIAALDQARNRVFFYDQDSNLLFVTGGAGDQKGLFRLPSAVEYMGDDILVLDSDKASITRLSPTAFGQLVLDATSYNTVGQYEKALEPWHKVLQMDANYEAAYRGIGKAQMANEQYKEALGYLRLGQDREGYSKVFKIVRNEVLRSNFYGILAGLAALIVLILFRKKIKAAIGWRVRLPVSQEETPWYPMRHLINGYEGLRRTKNKHVLWVAGLFVVIWFFVSLFQRQYTGFIFNTEKAETLNIFLILARTVGVFLLWCVSSLCVSSLLDGEGDLKHLFIVSGYSLVPMLITQLLYVILSNAITLEEQSLISLMVTMGYIWSGWLIFNGIREAHQFSGGRTLFCLFLTVFVMMMCALILVLLSSLVQQVIVFVMTIINEITLRRL